MVDRPRLGDRTVPCIHPFSRLPVRPLRFLILLLSASSLLACSSADSEKGREDAISSDSFITAYVELRIAALQAPGQELTLQARDQVLQELELEENDLLDFVEEYGKDVQLMRRIWEEVDSILEDRRRPREPSEPSDPRGNP